MTQSVIDIHSKPPLSGPLEATVIRPFDGLELDHCLNHASRTLQVPRAWLTWEAWYQLWPDQTCGFHRKLREPAKPTAAVTFLACVRCGPAMGAVAVYHDCRLVTTVLQPDEAFWGAVEMRRLPATGDPWWHDTLAASGAQLDAAKARGPKTPDGQ